MQFYRLSLIELVIVTTTTTSVQSNVAKCRITDLSPPRGCEWIRPILTPSNTWLLGLTRVSLQNGISISWAVSAQYISVTDTQTDTQTTLRATYVAVDRILCTAYIRCSLIMIWSYFHIGMYNSTSWCRRRTNLLKPRPHQQQCQSNIRLCRKNLSTCSIR